MTKQEKEARLKRKAELDSLHMDCYIYEWKAAQLRYQFLLKCVKQYELN